MINNLRFVSSVYLRIFFREIRRSYYIHSFKKHIFYHSHICKIKKQVLKFPKKIYRKIDDKSSFVYLLVDRFKTIFIRFFLYFF